VTMTSLPSNAVQSFSIPARGRYVTTLPAVVRIQSSEALAAIERTDGPGKLAINSAVPVSDGQATLVFPHAVIANGYTSTVTLANPSGTAQTVTVGFGSSVATLRIEPNALIRTSIASLLQSATRTDAVGAVSVNATTALGQPAVVGVLDIENESGLVTVGSRPAATEFVFPHVANGNGLFTGLAFATGVSASSITIEVYGPSGGSPKSATITLGANQQLARLVSELVTGTATQLGGYIRIRSDQPIWAWEIYGSGQVMASGPPL
jgi:hypothetical protein